MAEFGDEFGFDRAIANQGGLFPGMNMAGLPRVSPQAAVQGIASGLAGQQESPPLPHYPSQRYIDKNLAPEKTLTYDDVAALAQARKRAEATGVLTPELGEHMVPIGIVESRSGNFGVKNDNAFYAKPSTLKRFTDMGLSIGDTTSHTVPADRSAHLMIYRDEKGDKMIAPSGNYSGDPTVMARMMAAILGEKASLRGGDTVEGAVKLYNGKGRAIEHIADDNTYQQADVNQYWKKVQDAKAMLEHPKNAELMKHFNSIYGGVLDRAMKVLPGR